MKNAKWVEWLGTMAAAVATTVAFAFTTFETKDDAKDKKADIVQRLDRIENKIDKALEAK